MVRLLLVAAFASFLSSCAPPLSTWGMGSQAQVSEVTIEVWHNAPVAHTFTIYLVGSDGMARRLGRVSPSGTEAFRVPRTGLVGEYRLVAETATGGWVRSRFFSLNVSHGVSWDVDRNRIGPLWPPGTPNPESDQAEPADPESAEPDPKAGVVG